MLYHVSECAGIELFEPRPAPNADAGQSGSIVWAVDEEHLRNYFFPRDCPRICFRPTERTRSGDRERLMAESGADAVAVIESAWYSRMISTRLHLYTLPPDSFVLIDEAAGYWISREPVVPTGVIVVDDPVGELLSRNVELRITPSLRALAALVAASTMEFSMIRMRNCQ